MEALALYGFLIAVNLGPFLLAGLPWLARRPAPLLLITALASVPLGWLWIEYARTYYHFVPDGPRFEFRLVPPGLYLLALLGSAALRAISLGLRRFEVALGAIFAILLVGNVAGPSQVKRYNWEQQVIPLAKESFYWMGDRLITLPRVAVRSARDPQGKDLHGTIADDPLNPLPISVLQVSFYPYRSYGESGLSKVICPHLKREWSRRVCDGERTGLYRLLPYHVTFLKGPDLGTLWSAHQKPAARSVATRIARPGVAAGASAVECEPAPEGNVTHMCDAAVALGTGLVAVWRLPARDMEQAPQQAAAVSALFEYGLGPDEDVDALRRVFGRNQRVGR